MKSPFEKHWNFLRSLTRETWVHFEDIDTFETDFKKELEKQAKKAERESRPAHAHAFRLVQGGERKRRSNSAEAENASPPTKNQLKYCCEECSYWSEQEENCKASGGEFNECNQEKAPTKKKNII